MHIGDRIRHAREALNMRQNELGSMLGVTQAAVPGWELGRNLPPRHRLPPMAKALRVSTLHLDVRQLVPMETPKSAADILRRTKMQMADFLGQDVKTITVTFTL